MNFIFPMWARLAFVAVLAAILSFGVFKVTRAFDAKELGELKLQYAQEQGKALAAAVAQRDAAIKQRDATASKLAAIDASGIDNLRRFEHANQALAAGADAGTVRVRVIGAACPAAHDVPQAAAGGSVDPAAGAELGADARRRYFAFRGALGDAQAQLAACQQSLREVTGQ